MFAELELGMISERLGSDMAYAKVEGLKLSRPQMTKDDISRIFYCHYPAYLRGEMNVSEFAWVCDLSMNIIYKYIDIFK